MIKKIIIKIVRNILAIFFFILGIISGFLPFLQGWLFHLIGFILLDFEKKHILEKKIGYYLIKTKIGRKIYKSWIKNKIKWRKKWGI